MRGLGGENLRPDQRLMNNRIERLQELLGTWYHKLPNPGGDDVQFVEEVIVIFCDLTQVDG